MISKTEKNSIYLCGYFGENNFGDNLLLKVLINRLRCSFPKETIYVRSKSKVDYFASQANIIFLKNEYLLQNRGFFKLFYGTAFLFRNIAPIMKSKFFVVGGGGVFLDFQRLNFSIVLLYLLILISKICRTKVIVMGVSSDFITHRLNLFFIKLLLKKADFISVRDWLTYRHFVKILGNTEKKVNLASDLVWMLPIEDTQLNGDSEPRVWFNVMPLDYFFGNEQNNKVEAVIQHFIDVAKSHPKVGILITQSANAYNEGWLLERFQRVHDDVVCKTISFEENLNGVFSNGDLVITSRYHVGLFCIALNLRAILIDHEMKISSLAAEFPIDSIPVEKLEQLGADIFTIKYSSSGGCGLVDRQRQLSGLNFCWVR